MEYQVRAFNDAGLNAFKEHLANIKFHDLNTVFPFDSLFKEEFTIELSEEYFIEKKDFEDKFSAAKYLNDVFQLRGNKTLYYNVGFWTWLSAFYFEIVCPLEKDGKRKPGQEARHVLQDPKNHYTYYRHLLAGPARIYSELGDTGRIFLSGPLSKRGDIVEQLQAYQNIGLNKGIVEAADILYWDNTKNKLKKGAGSSGPGTPRRFVKVINQFGLTFDLNALDGQSIIQLFPHEFNRFMSIPV